MRIEVSTLRPGVSFTEPVYIEDDNLLVPAGIAVRKRDIQHLTSWGIHTVETTGQMVFPRLEKSSGVNTASGIPALSPAVPATPAPAQFQASSAAVPPRSAQLPADLAGGPAVGLAARPEDAAKKVISVSALKEAREDQGPYQSYLKLITRLQRIFDRISTKIRVENRDIDEITNELLLAVREQKGQIVGFVLGSDVEGRELAKSSVNTAIMAARTAIALRLPPHRLMHIITASLLHDAGMLRVPEEILKKQGSLSDEEANIMRSHVSSSYHVMCKEFSYPDEVGRIAWQHHERWDGQGYPRGLLGPQIDAGARIIAVADAFEAMVREKPYRTSLVGYEAMRNLVADYSRRFDPDVVKAFVRTMGIYPIGSIVALNNNFIARVMEVKAAAPLTPVVQVLVDDRENVFNNGEGALLDLLQAKNIYITRALDPDFLEKRRA